MAQAGTFVSQSIAAIDNARNSNHASNNDPASNSNHELTMGDGARLPVSLAGFLLTADLC
ncbi:hypothetical protein OAL43_01575 [bacterium]|nr:hypothetical protein [bacterium]MDC0278875.1 hypothetical protein [bacterium]